MEKENLPLYVHGMGRRRLGKPKEKLTEVEKQELIEQYSIGNLYEKTNREDTGKIIDYTI